MGEKSKFPIYLAGFLALLYAVFCTMPSTGMYMFEICRRWSTKVITASKVVSRVGVLFRILKF